MNIILSLFAGGMEKREKNDATQNATKLLNRTP